MSQDISPQVCARCGHQADGCARCSRVDPFLGGTIGDDSYCHTFSPGRPTCYETASGERVFPNNSKLAVDVTVFLAHLRGMGDELALIAREARVTKSSEGEQP